MIKALMYGEIKSAWNQSESKVLQAHKQIWQRKRILRKIYLEWYRKITSFLPKQSGKVLEIGSGIGNFKDYYGKNCIATDTLFNSWLDLCCDAQRLPFKNDSVSSIVCIDLIHHLDDPIRFLKEVSRVLQMGGRLVAVEPYMSKIAYLVRNMFHHEKSEYRIRKTGKVKHSQKLALSANLGIPTILFSVNPVSWQKDVPNLRTLYRELDSLFLYPLSGSILVT